MNLGYSGNVHISFKNKTITLSNSGANSLFRLLSVIFGKKLSYSTSDLPGKLMLYSKEKDSVLNSPISDLIDVRLLTQPMEMNSYNEVLTTNDSTTYQAVYTTYLSNRYLITNNIVIDAPTGKPIVTLALLDGNGTNILAAVQMTDQNMLTALANGDVSDQLLIKWAIRFENMADKGE